MTRAHTVRQLEDSPSISKGQGALTDGALGREDGDAVAAGRSMEMCALCRGSAGVADLDISHALDDPEL